MSTLESSLDLIQFLSRYREELTHQFPILKCALSPSGMLWISWPKRSSSIDTDLSERAVRETGLANGLVDVKVCAIDEDWSALKFVYRLADRF